MLRAAKDGVGIFVGFLILFVVPQWADAQTRELTSTDRLAILYTPQLQFTPEQDPLIRVGVIDDAKTVKFTPSHPIRVLPSGEGGPEIELPAKETYTVSISKSKAGKYKHAVVVERLASDQRAKIAKIQSRWLKRGYQTDTFEVGGLFAVQGKVFDSRTIFVGIGGMSSVKKARSLLRKLEQKFGIRGQIHSELSAYPTGQLTLTSNKGSWKIKTKDVLWVSPRKKDLNKINYTIPNVPKSYGKGYATRTYTGSLIFSPARNGELVAMVQLGAERLLKGVVPAETFASAPPQALRAQAVAARNEIFSAIGVRNLAEPYMLRGDVMDQVYGGTGVEDPRTSKAVDDTRGTVMFFKKKIVEAFYSSNAGGFTEDNENVWNMEPREYLRGHADGPKGTIPAYLKDGISESELKKFLADGFPAYSKTAPVGSAKSYRWKKTVPRKTAEGWLKKTGRSVGEIQNVTIKKRGRSGRVVQLIVEGTNGKKVFVERELNARRFFGGLRSGLFIMTINRNKTGRIESFSFDGAGFGHGVGMCQTGAMGMAAKGKSYRSILKSYYRGIELKKLY